MKRRNAHNSGFTMMEMLIVVAILAILMALAFVGVINYRRSMKQIELDRVAQEIFVAAQNHLTLAESQGALDRAELNKGSSYDRVIQNNGKSEKKTFHYFPKAGGEMPSAGTVLYDMLPDLSLDDTVRVGGSYFIEYDLDSATVTNVFYSDQSDLSSYNFEERNAAADYKALFGLDSGDNPSYYGADNAGNRLKGFKGANTIIGWYGGEDARNLVRDKLYPPTIQVLNDECLAIKVSFPVSALNKMMKNSSDAVLQLTIKGETSGHTRVVNATSEVGDGSLGESLGSFMAGVSKTEIDGSTARRYKVYFLDDITKPGGHFKELWCEGKDGLIPGENITIQARVIPKTTLANIATRDVSNPVNSLFASIVKEDGADAVAVAEVSYFRHLENLDVTISGYDPSLLGAMGAKAAVQKQDLLWKSSDNSTSEDVRPFINKIYDYTGRNRAEGETSFDHVSVYYLNGSADKPNIFTSPGTYAPVNPNYALIYSGEPADGEHDGEPYAISSVDVDVNAPAGLFGTLRSGSKVHDLKLIDCNIASSGGNAGALVGTARGTIIENVVAYNTPASDTGSKEISGAGSVGGLVGSMDGGSVTNSAAAVYVKSSGDASAGGLIGATTSAVTIDKSYAGGHTDNGVYVDSLDAGVVGRYNVQSDAAAGGLVGITAADTVIKNSYSTCSAYGATVGGLVGVSNGKEITNCYATGLVGGAPGASRGAFVGTYTTTTQFSNDYYLDIINYDGTSTLPAVASSTESVGGISMADASVESLSNFHSSRYKSTDAAMQKKQGAQPYDNVLKTYYNEMYPYKSTGELAAESYDGTSIHYGDWPSPETFVINVK